MISKDTGESANTRTSSLTDELGKVKAVFSDKTGTLTKNKMNFFSCSLRGKRYLMRPTDNALSESNDEQSKVCLELEELLALKDKYALEFLSLASLCHTVLPDFPDCARKHEHDLDCQSALHYQAESPDEKALLKMAKSHKYIFYNRQYDSVEICGSLSNIEIVTVNIFGENKVFKVLECFDFDSYRKRNSVLIEDGEGRIKLYMKGAENVVYKRLTEESKNELWDATSKHIDEFSKKGLRMLLCAYKSITKENFEEWYQRYKDTKVKGDEEAVEKIVDEMESGLELLGATAVEDQLQDDVPSTLNSLREAGIRVWMLTGDKTQTALNIAKSCSLLTAQMRFFPNIVVVDIDEFKSDDEVYAEVTEKLRRAWDKIKHLEQNSPNQAFVVSGRTLDLFFPKNTQLKIRKMNEMQKMMIQIIQKSRVVVCCRVSPYQKSQLVDLYKLNYPKDITLSIGDGANDVPMLKKANIGIGIIGKEGLQASRASDFSINQFKDLKSLTMYHGAMNCSRIAKKINFYLYKNVFDNFANFLYIFFTGFSNTFLLPQDGLATLNLLLTLMTLFIIGITEKKYSRKNSYRWPFLYKEGPDHKELNFKRFLLYVLKAFIDVLLIYMVTYFVFDVNYNSADGKGLALCYVSYSIFTSMLAVMTIQVIFEIEKFNVGHVLSYMFSMPLWWVLTLSLNELSFVLDNQGCAVYAIRQIPMWIATFLSCLFCCIGQFFYRFFTSYNFPNNLQIIRELEKIDREVEPSIVKVDEKEFEKYPVFEDSTLGYSEFYPEKRKKGFPTWRTFVKSKIVNSIMEVKR